MATINFRLKSKAKKNVSIYVYFRSPNTSQVIESRTGYTVHTDYWSSKKKTDSCKDARAKEFKSNASTARKFFAHKAQ